MGFFHACKEVVTQMASRIQGITVEIGGDTTKLSKALESVNKSIKGTQSGLKDVNKLLKLDPSNTELVVQKQKMLKDAIEATKEKLATLKTAAQQANEQLANGEITQQQYDALQREIVETEQNLRSLQDQAATTNATLAKIDEAGEKLQNIGSSVENVGKKFLPVTAAVTGLGTAAVKTAADFDSEMSKVSAISGATGDDFDQLRAKAREMGAKTKFSASEAASAMEYMAMAGWKTGDIPMLFSRSLAFISLPSMTAWTAHAAKVSLPRSAMCSTKCMPAIPLRRFALHGRVKASPASI